MPWVLKELGFYFPRIHGTVFLFRPAHVPLKNGSIPWIGKQNQFPIAAIYLETIFSLPKNVMVPIGSFFHSKIFQVPVVVKVDGDCHSQKGGRVGRGHDKPIHGSCAIYSRGGINQQLMDPLSKYLTVTGVYYHLKINQ